MFDAHSSADEQPWPFASLHSPSELQLDAPVHSGESGALVTGEQVPVAHVWHASPQAVLQHFPSLQLLDAHSVGPVQDWPFAFLHAPEALHVLLPIHSGSSSVLVTWVHVPVTHE